jgi:hypothetical protein
MLPAERRMVFADNGPSKGKMSEINRRLKITSMIIDSSLMRCDRKIAEDMISPIKDPMIRWLIFHLCAFISASTKSPSPSSTSRIQL